MTENTWQKVLVIGAGIAGINTALRLAEAGMIVYLCENKSYIGGTLFRLDKWFPDNHCGMCRTLPAPYDRSSSGFCLRKGLFHPGINVLVNSQVNHVEGGPGNFSVDVITASTGVNAERCTGCGLCEEVCPESPKAIQLNDATALKKTWNIDPDRCTKCGRCAGKCPANAIDLTMPEETRRLNVGNIILATGFEEFNAADATAFGYKRYPNVITNMELETLLSGKSYIAKICRPSDEKEIHSVAFLQCIGSRNRKRDYCSAVCCMFALKEAVLLKQADPEIDITIFFMDMRDFGKSYHRYYEEAREKYGIKFVRCRVPVVNQDFRTKDLMVTFTGEKKHIVTGRFDMVVLSVGQNPSPDFTGICYTLQISADKWGYCRTGEYSPVETDKPGIYACGTASGPKDIIDSLIESTSAAGQVLLSAADTSSLILNLPAEPAKTPDKEPGITVFVCNCHHLLSPFLNTANITAYAGSLPGVVKTIEVTAACGIDTRQQIMDCLKDNRVIIAGCPRVIPVGCTDNPMEIIDIRESFSWIHRSENEAAAEKVRRLLIMSLQKLKVPDTRNIPTAKITKRALVIGSGLAGITAAVQIARAGIEVDIIEKRNRPGGNTDKVHHLLENTEFPDYVQKMMDNISHNPLIHLKLNTELVKRSGYAGNYTGTLQEEKGTLTEIETGAIVLASGAEELRHDEYSYGRSEKVITQSELENRIAQKVIIPENIKSAAMIQCVGSRDSERQYCSRVCCMKTLRNALYLKQVNRQIDITIFYRDMMSYGLNEEYYTRAREQGILFVRYEPDKKPAVSIENGTLTLKAIEPELDEEITLQPDLVVLSPAIVPSNNKMAEVLGVELTADGFMQEADVKFRPVDLDAGTFVCGLAHSPRDFRETILQAQAAAGRVVALLTRSEPATGRNISTVNERRCAGCERCIHACPYHARVMDEGKKVARVIAELCHGCGICVATCPNQAAEVNTSTAEQMFSMIETIL